MVARLEPAAPSGAGRRDVRWGILGASRIVASTFLPSLAAAGGGSAELVAARDGARAARFAADHGIARSVEGYARAVDDPDLDALYVALPNALHAEWTIAALRAGKAVLCEKPFVDDLSQARAVLTAADETGVPVWEAFAFLFHDQTRRLAELLDAGTIGAVREVQATYHASLRDQGDIRYLPGLSGGALADVGVYPIRLGQLVLGERPTGVRASQLPLTGAANGRVEVETWGSVVDVESWGSVDYTGGRRLLFSASFTKAVDKTARILGETGEIRLSSPYSAEPADTMEIRDGHDVRVERRGSDQPKFSAQLRHIHAVLAGRAAPRHLAIDNAGTPAILDAVRRAARRAAEPVETLEPSTPASRRAQPS